MQKSIFPFVIISFLSLNGLFSQGFYDIEQIQEIKLTFSQTNWDAQLDQLKATDEEAYLLAASVEVNGIYFFVYL